MTMPSEPQTVTIGHIQQMRKLRSEALALGLEARDIERLDLSIWAMQQFYLLWAEPSPEFPLS